MPLYKDMWSLESEWKELVWSKYLNTIRRARVIDLTVLEQKYSSGIADGFSKNYMCVYISCVYSSYWFIRNTVVTEQNPFE